MSTPEEIRARIEALSQPHIVKEELPTWGTAYFRKISAETRFQLIGLQEEQGKRGLPAAVAIAVSLCNESGTLVYEDLAEGLKAVNQLPPDIHDELAGPALRVTGLGARALEDAEGKS